jgi:hypothetical protein
MIQSHANHSAPKYGIDAYRNHQRNGNHTLAELVELVVVMKRDGDVGHRLHPCVLDVELDAETGTDALYLCIQSNRGTVRVGYGTLPCKIGMRTAAHSFLVEDVPARL